MKTKLGIIGGAIVFIIFIVIMYYISTFGTIPPQEIFPDENNPLNKSPSETDDVYYYIDEKGVKHFVVEAVDDPKLSDQR